MFFWWKIFTIWQPKKWAWEGPTDFLEKIAPNDLLIMHHKIKCFE
jgi:hypothetical protein